MRVARDHEPLMPAVIEPETFGSEDDQAPTVVWVPTAHAMRDEERPPFALRQLDDDSVALLVFTSAETFVAGCGVSQPYIQVVAGAVQAFQHALGADVVLWDAVLNPAIQQSGEHDGEDA